MGLYLGDKHLSTVSSSVCLSEGQNDAIDLRFKAASPANDLTVAFIVNLYSVATTEALCEVELICEVYRLLFLLNCLMGGVGPFIL